VRPQAEGGNLREKMVDIRGETSNHTSEVSASIERASLRGAKEKTLALPRCFYERKLKMVVCL